MQIEITNSVKCADVKVSVTVSSDGILIWGPGGSGSLSFETAEEWGALIKAVDAARAAYARAFASQPQAAE